ncbi:MAG: mechanosensitive ion channel [Salinibacterium sp.]|nr:mechanosensitive ion channel [Salinibacterium sp.]
MTAFWMQPWFWPAVGVVVGLPVTLLILTELHSTLERRGSHATRIVMLLRNYVAPVGALLLLMSQAHYANVEFTWTRVVATVFGFLLILVLLNTINFALFVTAKEGSWRSRTPSIFVDIVRIILILIALGVLFSVVWSTDIGGLFAALGVGSIVIGLSLQTAVGSVVSGLFLLFEQPFGLGDWLEVNGARGRIVEVNWRAVHIKTARGILVIPNSSLAGGSFLNLSRKPSPFELDIVVKFSTDDPPQQVIDVCMQVAADLPAAVAGELPTITPMSKAKYEVEIPIASPGDNGSSIKLFRTRLWYAARRADLHLDGDLTDNFNTPANTEAAVRRVAPALYLTPEDVPVIAPQARLERWGEGEVIQQPQSIPEGMRYIISGTAQIATPIEAGAEVRFATLDRDDVVGLTALTRQGVDARITATSDLAVLFIPVAVLDGLVGSRPRLARDIGQEIDNRRTLAIAALEAAGVVIPPGTRIFG